VTSEHTKLPDAVLRMARLAEEQRRTYAANPDPLPVAEPEPEPDALELSSDELLAECADEPETDIGLGTRLIIRYGMILRHVTHVGWHGFDGRRWLEDASGAFTRQLAHKTAIWIDDEAIRLDCSDEEQADIEAGRIAAEEIKKLGKKTKDWTAEQMAEYERLDDLVARMRKVQDDRAGRMSSRHTFAKSAAGTNRINNMLAEAAPYLAVDVDDLNRDLFAFNCRTGTLRFFKPGPKEKWAVRRDPHRSTDNISKLGEVDFDPEARCPLFMSFLQRILPDPDIRGFLQRYFGLCLTGLTVEQCLVFFYGIGRNGKSTLVDLIVEMMGDYAVSMSIDSFAGDSRRSGAEATPDLARLPGARLVAASEPESGVHLKDALIKSLTGGEVISVRRLHQDFFELKPQFKIVLSGNHKPVIRDDSDGIWRRVFLVPFEVQIPEDEVDPELPVKLRREAAGIFGWLVRGCLDYLNSGLGVPDKVRAATAEYREESDPIGAFLRNGCHITGNADDRETPLDLFQAFSVFARREGLSDFKQSTFTKRLPDQTRKSWRGPDGQMHQFMKLKSGTTVYTGIRVRDEYRPQSEDPGAAARYSPGSMAYDDDPFSVDR
jgi:putative DNA primase/helicase